MFKTILCPIDFDGNSLEALRIAGSLTRRDAAKLYVMHVVAPTERTNIAASKMAERNEEQARRDLDKIGEQVLTGVNYSLVVRFGKPAEEIVAAAKDVVADLVVMATHGRSGVSHLMLGSVAEKVLRESSCPVLTVRMKQAEHSTEHSHTRPAA